MCSGPEAPPNLQFIPGVIRGGLPGQLGTGLEATTDEGEAKRGVPRSRVTWIPSRWVCRPHVVSFRTASESTDGRVSMQLVDSEGNIHALGNLSSPPRADGRSGARPRMWTSQSKGSGCFALGPGRPVQFELVGVRACGEGALPFGLQLRPPRHRDDGSCDLDECAGCLRPSAQFFISAQLDDGSCVFGKRLSDIDGDSAVTTSDLLALLAAFGDGCSP